MLPKAKPELAFYHREWIDLHSGPGFATFVDYLRGLLDRVGPSLPDAEFEAMFADFMEAVKYENSFWAMAMGDDKKAEL